MNVYNPVVSIKRETHRVVCISQDGAGPTLPRFGFTLKMDSERRPDSSHKGPEGQRKKSWKEFFEKKTPEEAVEWVFEWARRARIERLKRNYRRIHRPVRLHVTPSERQRLKPPTVEDKERLGKVWETVLEKSEADPTLLGEIIEDFTDLLQDHEKIDKARAQLTPLAPEEVETQAVEGAINLLKSESTMSGKINLVEKLQPEQLDTLRQRDPGFIEPVIKGLTKRPARKERAQRRVLDIYQRRGEDEPRP